MQNNQLSRTMTIIAERTASTPFACSARPSDGSLWKPEERSPTPSSAADWAPDLQESPQALALRAVAPLSPSALRPFRCREDLNSRTAYIPLPVEFHCCLIKGASSSVLRLCEAPNLLCASGTGNRCEAARRMRILVRAGFQELTEDLISLPIKLPPTSAPPSLRGIWRFENQNPWRPDSVMLLRNNHPAQLSPSAERALTGGFHLPLTPRRGCDVLSPRA
ncbi:uncharacterized protein [Pleurodeles waltl]|uniref:uncharacterized protein n=1 Tax=Pleurodeles waltl TaxID=8319 RepID=UPI0037098122